MLAWCILACATLQEPQPPEIAAASDEGERAIARFSVPDGHAVDLYAAEPMLANPASICFDEHGRLYVAENFRRAGHGVVDNRHHRDWIEDDMRSQTVADRLALYREHRPGYLELFTRDSERIRRLVDDDRDGVADRSTVFAAGFDDVLDGAGTGLLARDGRVWFTCIPHLWLLRDVDGDGRADEREALSSGYGVRVALRGHDLHGLCMGFDGRLYFTVGDRGYHVRTREGKTLADPGRGAVFRCWPDGSELEVFATGLRNPQELAFDDHGNLFTGDNNSDAGDPARLLSVVEGGEYGWRMNFQYVPEQGAWNRERWWDLPFEGRAAFVLPPVAHVTSGPAGLSAYPGVGLSRDYFGALFLVDFRGSAQNSGVHALWPEPDGAGFALRKRERFWWGVLATDCAFGPDGAFYVSDWVHGWEGEGKGRIYRLSHELYGANPAIEQARTLRSTGLGDKTATELQPLLVHMHRGLRLEAQWELARRGEEGREALRAVLERSSHPIGRLHAIWGLGQLAHHSGEARAALRPFLFGDTGEIRAQVAKVLGDCRDAAATEDLIECLDSAEPQLRFHAAIALGRISAPEAVGELLAMLRKNDGDDAFLRHAGVMGLAGCAEEVELAALRDADSSELRLAAVLALRRLASGAVAAFLEDADPSVRRAAARAIHDEPLREQLDALAAVAERDDWAADEPLARRVLSALEQTDRGDRLARIATDAGLPARVRATALRILRDWEDPVEFDPVLNTWIPDRPERRDPEPVRAVIGHALADLLNDSEQAVRLAAPQTAEVHGRVALGPDLHDRVADSEEATAVRTACLRALRTLEAAELRDALELALASGPGALRNEAIALLAVTDPALALPILEQSLQRGTPREAQIAIELLAGLDDARADRVLDAWLRGFDAPEDFPAALMLEMRDAITRRQEALGAMPAFASRYLGLFFPNGPDPEQALLEGGDPIRGRTIFFEKPETECLRCHAVPGRSPGSATEEIIGPDLRAVATRLDRHQLLQSILAPNEEIAEGFDQVLLETHGERLFVGRILSETPERIRLLTDEAGRSAVIELDPADVAARTPASSAMPDNLREFLTPRELRDLVAWLATLDEAKS